MAIVYAAKDIRVSMATTIEKLHANGWTRPMLQVATGLTPAQTWRIRDGRAHAREVPIIEAFLVALAEGKIKKPAPATKEPKVDVAALLARIDELEARVAALEADREPEADDQE
jgi:hypothetical protein